MNRKALILFALFTGGIPLILAACILFAAGTAFFLGRPVSAWVMPIGSALVACFLMVWIWKSRSQRLPGKKDITVSFILLGIFTALAALISWFHYDLSWDGLWYHSWGIVDLIKGWNPVWVPLQPDNTNQGQELASLLVDAYTKGSWILAVSVYKVTGKIELGKIWNFLYLFSSFCLSFAALLSFKKVRPWQALVLSLLVALNPVAIYQLLTFYVDGSLASLLISLLSLWILFINQEELFTSANDSTFFYVTLCAAIILLVNIKLTGAAYALCFSAGFLFWHYLENVQFLKNQHLPDNPTINYFLPQTLKVFKTFRVFIRTSAKDSSWRSIKVLLPVLAVGFSIAVLWVGFNPYVTNTASGRWASVSDTAAIQTNMPQSLRPLNSIQRLSVSLFSRSYNGRGKPLIFKLPITFYPEELTAFISADARVGGFGPFFSGALVLSALALACSLFRLAKSQDRRDALFTLYILFLVILSVLVYPDAWWARFVPQAWIAPLLILLLPVVMGWKDIFSRFAPVVVCLVLALNLAVVSYAHLNYQIPTNRSLWEQLYELKNQKEPVRVDFNKFAGNQLRFDIWGINYIAEHPLTCENKVALLTTTITLFCEK